MVKEIEYDSFGNVLHDSFQQLSFPLGFAGGLVDEHTGFIRFGYRDYDPQTGRFTAQDPARDLRGDADLYDYCVDDPVSCIDPQGLRFTEAEASSGGASHKGISHPFGAPHGQSAGNGVDQNDEDKSASNTLSPAGNEQRIGDKVKEVEKIKVESKWKEYYVIGKRPLKGWGGETGYGKGENKLQHRQFIKNNGYNFGLSGENGGVVPFQDNEDQLKKYEYFDGNKYKAEFIDAARAELEQEWQEEFGSSKQHNQERITPARTGAIFHGMDEGLQRETRYRLINYNCQNYVDDVVARARKIAERKGEKLEVE
ncbi:RHS repeat domain-containing protein [Desulfovibrio cuneatus]|uniref:RHS repeat domain-containing protein n=1 Tax=Desulfovibrio cuneatus TaxID=159728 RepID=UPI0012EC6917|nr:RHS repeat-associated core domain-containing protein [Desulfovibrio cuneatus]